MKNIALLILAFPFLLSGCKNEVQPSTSTTKTIAFTTASQSACQDNGIQTKATDDCSTITSKFDNENLKVTVRQKGFCNSTFKLSSEIVNNKLILKADDTSTEGSRCFCFYNLDYNFNTANKDSYDVEYTGKVLNNDPCNAISTLKK